jgi:hypothetical protein
VPQFACLTEGQSIRAAERLTGIHGDETTMLLGERIARGCAEQQDRMMVGFWTASHLEYLTNSHGLQSPK